MALVPGAPTMDLLTAMRLTGVSSFTDRGTTFYADGRVHIGPRVTTPQDACGKVQAPLSGTRGILACGIDASSGLTIIGATSTSYGPMSVVPAITGPNGYIGLTGGGTEYTMDSPKSRVRSECASALVGAAGAALSLIQQVRANSGAYSASVNYAVNTVFQRYQGTTMGVAAAVEFMVALIAAVGAGEALMLLALAGVTIGAIWIFVACSDVGTGGG